MPFEPASPSGRKVRCVACHFEGWPWDAPEETMPASWWQAQHEQEHPFPCLDGCDRAFLNPYAQRAHRQAHLWVPTREIPRGR